MSPNYKEEAQVSRFTVPPTIDGATSALTSLDGLVTAKNWERAAIVFAFCAPQQGRRTSVSSNGSLSVSEFAALGVKGLTTHNSVNRYRDAWQSAMDEGHALNALPGKEVKLPDLPFPPHVEVTDSTRREALNAAADAEGAGHRSTQQIATHLPALKAAIKADPKVAAAAMKALDERYEDSPKPVRRTDDTSQPFDLTSEFRKLHRSVDSIISLVIEGKAVVSEAQRDAVLREVQWLRTALGYIEDGVTSDSLDEVLAEMLRTGK